MKTPPAMEALGVDLEAAAAGGSPFQSKAICTGVVRETHLQSGLITVKTDTSTQVTAYYVPHFFGSLFGLKMHYMPPAGSRVVLLKGDKEPHYVIGMLPAGGLSMIADPTKVAEGINMTGRPLNTRQRMNAFLGTIRPPLDLLEGELCLDNEKGVMLALLTHLVKLQAGDLARIECLALNDMVRVISQNYAHHNAMGDMTIRNEEGKLNLEWHGTSLEHEADGREQATDPMMGLGAKRQKPTSNPEAEAEEDYVDGRWRMSLFVGWMGDFINLFISDPAQGLQKLLGVENLPEGDHRSGKFRFTVGDDGSALLQSVSDIVLERVVRIPVPIRARDFEDPGATSQRGELGEDASDAVQAAMAGLKRPTYAKAPLDKEWTPSDADSIHEMVYQLRHYARWLNQSWTLRRFRALSETFKVPSEDSVAEPEIAGFLERYSTIRIFRDGSQLLLDAYGNAVHLTKEGVTISSTANLRLEAAGNLYLMAGGRLNMVAKKNISISTPENIKLRASDTLLHIKKTSEIVFIAAKNFFSGVINVAKSVFIAEDLHVTGDALVKVDVEIGENLRVGGTAEVGGATKLGNTLDVVGATKVSGTLDATGTITTSRIEAANSAIALPVNANKDRLVPGTPGTPSSAEAPSPPDLADSIEELAEVEDVDNDDSHPWYESLSQQIMREKETGTEWDPKEKWADKITQKKTFDSETNALDELAEADNLDRIREQPNALSDQSMNLRTNE